MSLEASAALDGTVVNSVIVLDHSLTLVDGPRVAVVVKSTPAEQPTATNGGTLAERLLKHAGIVTDLPQDMAARHDHYIHGTP